MATKNNDGSRAAPATRRERESERKPQKVREREKGPKPDGDAAKRLSLLFYIPALIDGGAERVMAGLASHFAAQGHRVMMAVDFEGGGNAPELAANVRLVKLPGGHRNSIEKLARLIVMSRPDIAISAIASASFKLSLALLNARRHARKHDKTKKLPTRLVLTYHGFDEYRTGRLSWLGFAALPLLSRLADRVVAVSDALADYLARRWRARKSSLMRIYNPVAIPSPPAGEEITPPAQREKIILAIGRLVAAKRFDLLLEAFARMKEKKARLVILGEGPEREALAKLARHLDIADRLEMPGYVADIGSYLARARLFAMVSQSESFGLVLVEALAFGLPVIATDCGGPREILANGEYGTLLPNDIDALELAARLDEALARPGEPEGRMERAREFSLEKGAGLYMDMFYQILAHKR
jgi:glycosyltransferase involved in cell wall biosynthesis